VVHGFCRGWRLPEVSPPMAVPFPAESARPAL
jgi:hypothetical protein